MCEPHSRSCLSVKSEGLTVLCSDPHDGSPPPRHPCGPSPTTPRRSVLRRHAGLGDASTAFQAASSLGAPTPAACPPRAALPLLSEVFAQTLPSHRWLPSPVYIKSQPQAPLVSPLVFFIVFFATCLSCFPWPL